MEVPASPVPTPIWAGSSPPDSARPATASSSPGPVAPSSVAAKELEVDYVVYDNTDPDIHGGRPQPVPAPWTPSSTSPPRARSRRSRTYTLAERRAAWHEALDATVAGTGTDPADRRGSPAIGRVRRLGGPRAPADGSIGAAVKAALSDWTSGQTETYGTRGITINVVAAGRGGDRLRRAAPRSPLSPTRSPAWPCSWRAPRPGTSPAKRCT